jgi:hypothetical protein
MNEIAMTPQNIAIIIFGAVVFGLAILACLFGILNMIARAVGGWRKLLPALGFIAILCLCVAMALWIK